MLPAELKPPPSCAPASIFCGLNGLVLPDASALGLRECWTPWTIEVWRWWPYDCDGLRSTSKLCFGFSWTTGVVPLGDAVPVRAPFALSARPRVREWSRDGGSGWAIGGAMSSGSRGGLAAESECEAGDVTARPSDDCGAAVEQNVVSETAVRKQ